MIVVSRACPRSGLCHLLAAVACLGICGHLSAQIPTLAKPPVIPGCYDLSFRGTDGKDQLIGRVAFDTVIANARQPSADWLLRFISGPNRPHGSWHLGNADSILMVVTYIDAGIRFNFPRIGADTLHGWGQYHGMVSDPVTRHPALAIKQPAC